uniref:Uncharacterized protein n=1 Tax=Dictyoglomus thermophilum TaxID=14 RepID=A0A7C3RN57_DICTH
MKDKVRLVEILFFIGLLLVILFSTIPLFNINIPENIYNMVYLFVEFLAFVVALLFFFKIDRKQKLWFGWLFILLGFFIYLLSDFLDIIFKFENAQMLKLLSFILNFVALLLFIIFLSSSLRVRLSFNENFLLVINAILLFILILQVGILPTLLNSTMLLEDKIINILFLIGDYMLLVVFMILFLTITTNFWGGEIAKNYYLLTLSIALLSVANLIFSYILSSYELFKINRIIYLGGYMVIAYSIVKEGVLHEA